MKNDLSRGLIPSVIIIVSLIQELSVIGLIMWGIGTTLTFTFLNKNGVGINMIKNKKRKIMLGIGMTITILSLVNEIKIYSLIFFAIGFIWVVMLLEKDNIEDKKGQD